MKENVERAIAEAVLEHLGPHLTQFHRFQKPRVLSPLEIMGTVRDGESPTCILHVNYKHDLKMAGIPVIFMPEFMQHKGLGKGLLSVIHQVLKEHDYELRVYQLTSGFYRRLVARGAQVLSEDMVAITDQTRLT